MKVFIDSDIFMDIFFHREPFYDDSATILDMVVEKRISGITSPIIIANLYYLTRKNNAAQLRVVEFLKIDKIKIWK
jgi:predicted nucleic acid-binding protein